MTELSLYILDIACNSTRAKAKRVTVEVAADTAADILAVVISDDGCGMSPQLLAAVSDPFTTTRTTRKVGMGIPLYRMLAEQCGGTLAITSEEGVGTRVAASFQIRHIDRPPLGDLAETMVTLIGGAPETDFSLVYRVNKNFYEFDTAKIKEALGEDDLSDITVLSYLKDMLHENIIEINGGLIL